VHELTFTDPCIIFALARESQAFLREFRPHQRFPEAPCPAQFCGPAWLTVLVTEAGVGRARTERALDWLLSGPALGNVPYRPRVVLSAGFAGALSAELRVGDVVLATDVIDADGNPWPATWPEELPGGEWRPPLHRGRVLTMPHIVSRPEDKEALGRQHHAVAVDMESAVVARLCLERQVRFGCVRVISDDRQTPLSPRLAGCLAGGRVSLLRLLASIMRSPKLVSELWRLGRHTKFASQQLGAALGELLTLTLPWGGEL
jgi:adenosylhomocysteine nucleosidase